MSLTDFLKRHMKSQPTMPPPLEGPKKKKKSWKIPAINLAEYPTLTHNQTPYFVWIDKTILKNWK